MEAQCVLQMQPFAHSVSVLAGTYEHIVGVGGGVVAGERLICFGCERRRRLDQKA